MLKIAVRKAVALAHPGIISGRQAAYRLADKMLLDLEISKIIYVLKETLEFSGI